MKSGILNKLRNSRGMTLVELMIVVAIVGILAAVGGAAFFRQTKRAKITRLEQYAMDAARGQEAFFSRHGIYYPIDNTQSAKMTAQQDSNNQASERYRWKQVLGFNHEDMPPEVEAFAYGGTIDETCGSCTDFQEVVPDAASANPQAWYAIEFRQDLNGDPSDFTRVIITSQLKSPLILDEGK